MDRRLTLCIAVSTLIFSACLAVAAPVAPSRAAQAAGAALARGSSQTAYSSLRTPMAAEPVVTPRVHDGKVVYYTVNQPDGWAIVSADDSVYPVIAYSDTPVDPAVPVPAAYQWWMDQVASQISEAVSFGLPAGPEVESAWAALEPVAGLPEPTAVGDVGPLLPTMWNQGTGYNTYCPVDAAATGSGGRVWAGCVATTMAQIMKYYNWPIQGVGTHVDTNSGYGSLSVSPGNTTYAWSSMTLNAGSTASALLMYHAGVAANMRYGASGSGATVEGARTGLIDHFRYKSTATHVYRYNYDQSSWNAAVKAELDAARPVFYAGYTPSTGHAFVVDGYRAADGLFHVNWGWGSAYDGYFLLNALNPATYAFNLNQEAIFGITPDNQSLVAKPTFSVTPGTYSSARSVQISCATAGATVRYTLDGTVPTSTTGTVYDLVTRPAISIAATKTLRAVAYKTGMAQSYQAAGTYTITSTVAAAPTLSPAGGTYKGTQTVTLASATAGATIRYTLDGTTPSQTTGTVYSAPITVSSTTTVKAIAFKSGAAAQSATSSAVYYITSTVAATPLTSLVAGTYTGTKSVTLTCATVGATIRYTLDNSIPTQSNGTVYTGAISISASKTVRAIAFKSGSHATSATLTAAYKIVSATAAVPTMNLGTGTYAGTQTLSISCATPGAYIYYTTNGTTPTQLSVKYSAPLSIASSQTVNAIAVVPSTHGQSALKSATITIVAGVAAAPKTSLVAGTYAGAKSVTLSTTTTGATIRYTLDNTNPSQTSGTVYTGAISISASKTLRAIAYKSGAYASSPQLSAVYKIVTPTAAVPTFSLGAGTYNGTQSLTMTCTTPGAYIYYTTNGTTPTQASTRYTTPLSIAASQTVNAIAVVPSSYGQSAVKSAAYSIVTVVAATPKTSLVAGTYTGARSVTLSTTTTGATIRYTIDNTIPSQTNGIVYSAAISIPSTKTLRAIAYKPGSYASSAQLTATYTVVTPTAATPTFSLAAGTYTTAKTLSITCATANAYIYYTINGTVPTQASTKYTTPLTISSTQTVNAIAVVPNVAGQSGVRTAVYTMNIAAQPLLARVGVTADPTSDIFAEDDFAQVAPGTFIMGGEEGFGEADELPAHVATIEEPFEMMRREVTIAQFSSLMGDGVWSEPACPTCPVTNVNRDEALEFTARLNLAAGTDIYALPTETQWEYAARGGANSAGYDYPGAEDASALAQIAWFSGIGAVQTTQVGRLAPNELGLYDMAGNAAEWVSDDYAPYGTVPIPLGYGVVRGGGFRDLAEDLRCASRKAVPVGEKNSGYGFRLVRSIR